MHKQVWKFALELTDIQLVTMPIGAVVLSVQVQRGVLCIWAEVNIDAETELKRFVIYATGQAMKLGHGKFIGTFQIEGGAFVFHAFEG